MSLSNSLGEFFRHPFVEKLGWALLHFVWQGVALAILLCVILAVMRRVTANARYLVACMGLLLMAALPAVTLGFLASKPDTSRSALGVGSDNALEMADFTVTVSGQSTVTQSLPLSGTTVVPTNPARTLPDMDAIAGRNPVVIPALSLAERCESFLRPWLPCMTMVWLAGVVALALRLLFAWTQVQRLQTHGVFPAEPDRIRLLEQLATRLDMRQAVTLLESSLIEVPTVIGWLKPVILLPIASVNSLTVSQLEAILAHELAHIRRADYAVNLLQSLIETLLFYHPAVWWISARIRQEREHCCDDLATAICGDKATYIAAPVRMEELRCEPRSVAVAARGGHLLKRVRRLLAPKSHDRLSPWWLTGAAALLVVGGLIGLPVLSKSQAEPVVLQETEEKQKQDNAPRPPGPEQHLVQRRCQLV